MTRPYLLGVDPGMLDGAAILLEPTGRRVLSWCAWWTCQRATVSTLVWTQTTEPDEEPIRARVVRPYQWPLRCWAPRWCGQAEEAEIRARIAIEQPLGTTGGMDSRSHAAAWKAHGIALGVVGDWYGQPHTPTAQEWRGRAFRGGRLTKDVAEARAVQLAEAAFDWTSGGDRGGLSKKARGALAEAAWIARDLLSVSL